LKRIWKEAVRMDGIPAANRAEHFLNMSPDPDLYNNVLDADTSISK
jgi:hypothetical protein